MGARTESLSDPGLLKRLVAKYGRDVVFEKLSAKEVEAANFTWELFARPNQLPPPGDDWLYWMILSGRGFGKTRAGIEWILSLVNAGEAPRVALVGRNAADVRDVMIEGESGILACAPPWNKPMYEPSKRRVTWTNPNFPSHGAVATSYFGDSPDQLRGPQFSAAFVDELAKFQHPTETWTQLQFGMRLGKNPRTCITTTPRPIKIIRKLVEDDRCVVVQGSSWENIENLAPAYRKTLEGWKGTRIGRQEIEGQVLEDIDGSLVSRENIDDCQLGKGEQIPDLDLICVSVDPAMTSGENANDTGIIVAGRADDKAYVLHDGSIKGSSDEWGRAAISAYDQYSADCIVIETNQGGDLVKGVIEQIDRNIPIVGVRATRGKHVRFAPVAALYENRRIIHRKSFEQLEDELLLFSASGYEGSSSPDRADALVWAIHHLILGGRPDPRIISLDW